MDLVNYPGVVIDGDAFVLKVTLGALRRLEEWNIDISKVMRQPTDEEPYSQTESNESFKRLSANLAAFAHVERAGKLKWAGLNPDQVADALGLEDVGPMTMAVTDAWGKVAPTENNQSAEPAPTPATAG